MSEQGQRIIERWMGSEFLFLLALAQLIVLIPLSQFLPELDREVAQMYILIPIMLMVSSKYIQDRLRGVKVSQVLFYGTLGFLVTTLVAYFLFTSVLDAQLSTVEKPGITSLIVMQVLFVAPSEELAFRFALPAYIRRKLPRSWKWTPAILSSILFALFHYSAYSGNWTSILLAFVVGMIWALAYSRWGLGATIGSHAAYNLVVAGLWTSLGGL